mgnify:CR=1 FL=1
MVVDTAELVPYHELADDECSQEGERGDSVYMVEFGHKVNKRIRIL